MVRITAAVIQENGGPFHLDELELDDPREDEVLVRLVAVGLCHTDLHFVHMGPVPSVLGHEGAGIVEQIGTAVTGFTPGDRVLISFRSCGSCRNCLKNRPSYCEQFLALNMAGGRPDGTTSIKTLEGQSVASNFFGQSSFATRALAYPRNLVKVPDSVSDEVFRTLAPLGCGIQTGAGGVMNSLNPAEGSSIVISGAGGVGLSAVLGAKVRRAAKIIVMDINEERLKLAEKLGATDVINPKTTADVVATIQEITAGGADYGVDTTGNMGVIRTLVDATHNTGEVGLIGAAKPGSEMVLDHFTVSLGRVVRGVVEGDSIPQEFIPELIDLHLRGEFPFDEFVKTYRFDEIQQAREDSENGSTVKAILVFD